MQKTLGLDLGHFQVLDVGIVDHQHLTGFLDVDDEFGPEMRRHDRCDARLGVVFLCVVSHAAGALDLERLQRVAVHDHVLRRPIGAGDGIFVLVSLEFRCFDRARFRADLDLGHGRRRVHPKIDHRYPRIAPDHEQVAPGCRNAADVNGITSVDDGLNFIAVAVDQGDLPGIAQGHREQVVDVQIIDLLRGSVGEGHQQFPAFADFRHPEFRRLRRVNHQVFRHQLDIFIAQLARCAPVGHAGRRTIGDEAMQIVKPQIAGQVGCQRLTGSAFAQHPVTSGATLKEYLLAALEVLDAQQGLVWCNTFDLDPQIGWCVGLRNIVLRPSRTPKKRGRGDP